MREYFGFTLFDLMIAIAIASVLLGLGAPNLAHVLAKHTADANAHTVWRTLAKTREAAVLSGERATFCGVDNNNHCVRDDINAFVVFHDHDRDQKLGASETPIRRVELDFAGTVFLRASNQKHITYANDGHARQFGSVVLCPDNKKPQYIRRITVNPAGRPYLAWDRDGDGIIANADGSPIDCEHD